MFGSFNKTLSYTIFYQLSLSTEELQDWSTHFKCACHSVTSALTEIEQKPEGWGGIFVRHYVLNIWLKSRVSRILFRKKKDAMRKEYQVE